MGTTLPRGAKILPCLLTQTNSRDIFFLLIATELAPQGNVVPKKRFVRHRFAQRQPVFICALNPVSAAYTQF